MQECVCEMYVGVCEMQECVKCTGCACEMYVGVCEMQECVCEMQVCVKCRSV